VRTARIVLDRRAKTVVAQLTQAGAIAAAMALSEEKPR